MGEERVTELKKINRNYSILKTMKKIFNIDRESCQTTSKCLLYIIKFSEREEEIEKIREIFLKI